jgi:small-conductance mechanosensitive channel
MSDTLGQVTSYATAAFYVALGVLLGWIADRFVARVLGRSMERALGRRGIEAPSNVPRAIRGTFVWIGLFAGVYFAARELPLSASVQDVTDSVLFVGMVLVVTNAAVHLSIAAIRIYLAARERVMPASSIFEAIIYVLYYGVAILVVLAHFGVSIAPFLAAAGVTGIVLGLALQDTLSSLIAGLQIVAAGQIKVGDYIQLDTGEEGRVTDVNWRNTVVATVVGNEVVVPNSRLATTVVTNFEMPETEFNVNVDVGVSYGSDLERVESVTLDVARQVLADVDGTVDGFEPFMRYQGFGDSSIGLKVFMRVREYEARYVLVHEFVKRLHARYEQEGIEIPFPQRTVHVEPEG